MKKNGCRASFEIASKNSCQWCLIVMNACRKSVQIARLGCLMFWVEGFKNAKWQGSPFLDLSRISLSMPKWVSFCEWEFPYPFALARDLVMPLLLLLLLAISRVHFWKFWQPVWKLSKVRNEGVSEGGWNVWGLLVAKQSWMDAGFAVLMTEKKCERPSELMQS